MMDFQFKQWVELTDVYAHRLSAAASGDPQAWADLKHLADDIRKFGRGPDRTGDGSDSLCGWPAWPSDRVDPFR